MTKEMTKAITLESKVEQFRDAVDYGWDLGNLITVISSVCIFTSLKNFENIVWDLKQNTGHENF